VMAKKPKLVQKIGYRTDGSTPWLLTYQLNATIKV